MAEAPNRSPDDGTLHILRLCSLGRLSEALTALRSPALHPSSAYAAVLHACARHRCLAAGRSLHRLLVSRHPSPCLFLSNHLLNFYAKCGRLDMARRLFDGMPRRNLVSWTALLSGYAQHGLHDRCFRLLAAMLSHHLPNEFALAAALSSCAGAHHYGCGRQVHALACKISLDANVFVGNALITMYSSCAGHGDDGWSVFQCMPFRNLITWNSMIAGFNLNGQPCRSLHLFSQMHRIGIGFDRATLVSIISSCSSLRDCHQLHCLTVKTCYVSEAEVATALVKGYSGLGGSVDDCYRVFSGVKEHDIVSWTGIITSRAEQEPEEAIRLFCQLRWHGFEPDRYTFSIVVKACAGFATVMHCSAVHSLIVRSGFGDDMVLSNAMIHAYARCGSIMLAESVFKEMVVHDEVSWNSMIKAYAAHGRGREALRAFERMDVPPDSATFVGLLTACSHCGLVNEGQDVFKSMSEVYKITPQLDHYACMVDILGRAGKLLEAEDLINRMPMAPDSVIWSALLGACRKHGEARIGEKAAQKLMELEPQNSVGYVMMSNIYCEAGSLGDAAFVRKEMKDCGVKKKPGLSWVGIGKHVHEFSVGGRHHPQREAIYVEVRRLADKLKEMGYVADTRLVLHEMEEEHKEERLLHHSEKLALTFALMNASATQDGIRIMKNIRICEDCHNFIKLASRGVEKEIIVRDANRFHHFVDGFCSCGDYW
ncbi:pentatricopeptide repeat-containing protein [Cocos nucifera]|uniref:Pentatricopeptide repeat-containing protein n=1 Tax=Cocos nucifera TaxID=13894 RepID=A0A8K0IUR7_COCNU|nr:pentatricopeptide repeat-containing protein [Cocos nucifera]